LSTLLLRSPEAASATVQFEITRDDAPRWTLSSELRSAGVENRCPVCQARFRGARICSRCGADLEPLMALAVKAWQLRQAARQALYAGDVDQSIELATEAQGVQGAGSGEALRLLSAWLKTMCVSSSSGSSPR
jgi:hypothetical protein